MAKLVVEVLDASDLGPPKNGNGSASTYVEVEFDEQLQRTQTKPSDFNPQWNEKLLFNVTTPAQFPNATIEVVVYNDKTGGGGGGGGGGHHKHFLGRVRISGGSVAWSESQAMVQRYPLDKPGLFAHTRGDLALRIYAIQGFSEPFVANGAACEDAGSPLQEVNTNNLEGDQDSGDKQKKKKKKKKKQSRLWT